MNLSIDWRSEVWWLLSQPKIRPNDLEYRGLSTRSLKQFSGNRPAVIVCSVPEIDSFAGVEKLGTETYALVHRFLKQEDAQNIVSLTFASDPIIDFRPGEIYTGLPSVRFVSQKFRGSHLEKF